MIRLNPTQKLEFYLGGAVTTNQLTFTASYTDISTTSWGQTAAGDNDGISDDGNVVTLIDAPSSNNSRIVQQFTIYQKDTVDAVVTLQKDNNSTDREIFSITLSPGDTLEYQQGAGWKVMDSNGATKTEFGSSNVDIDGGNIDGTVIGANSAAAGTFTDLTVNGNTTLGDTTADTITFTGRLASDFVPSTDSSRDFGTTSLRFANLYVDNIGDTGQTMTVTGSVNFDSDTLFVDHSNNRVGIGTASPGRLVEVAGDVLLKANDPFVVFEESDASADNKRWLLRTLNEEFFIQAQTDAGAGGGDSIKILRSSNSITSLDFLTGGTAWARIDNANEALLIGTTTAATGNPTLDIVGSRAISIANSTTDATGKDGYITSRHYTNLEENLLVLAGSTTSGGNTVRIGGGSSAFNAATQISLYGAANTTTTTGTEVARISDTENNLINDTKIGGSVGDTPGARLYVVDSGTPTQVLDSTSSGAQGSILDTRHSPGAGNMADGDVIFSFLHRGRDDGNNLTIFARTNIIADTVADGSEDGRYVFQTVQGGSSAARLNIGAGIYTPNATGGDQGADTINASEVYDDGTLLTCYPLAIVSRGIDTSDPVQRQSLLDEFDSLIPDYETDGEVWMPRKHWGLRKFLKRIGTEHDPLTIKGFTKHWHDKGHLSPYPNEQKHRHNSMSTGEWITSGIEVDEIQAIHIAQLDRRCDALEGEVKAIKQHLGI